MTKPNSAPLGLVQVPTAVESSPDPAFSAACSTETTADEASPVCRSKLTRRNADERYEESLDKMYADFVKFEAARRLPHMEWDGSDFVPQRPAPQPVLQVNATIMVLV